MSMEAPDMFDRVLRRLLEERDNAKAWEARCKAEVASHAETKDRLRDAASNVRSTESKHSILEREIAALGKLVGPKVLEKHKADFAREVDDIPF